MRTAFFAIVAAAVLAGCGTTKISRQFYWGSYEGLLYDQYANPGRATPELQIALMEKDIEIARSCQCRLPPGFHAHLGYQYLQAGRGADARRAFDAEKSLYPESARLIDRFTAKLR